jgi:Lrp/AsnC family leucine-responsive transcriptional regulator
MADPANSGNFDAIDLKILRELQADARLPNSVLAERVGLSPSPCSRRVRLLEESGAIESYRTIVNRAAVGLGLTVFAGIRVGRHSAAGKDSFIKMLLAMPEVIACHLISGDVDFLIEVVVRDMATYEATVLNRLLSLPELRDIRTSFAMRTYRSSGPLPLSSAS